MDEQMKKDIEATIEKMVKEGLVERQSGFLTVTPKGRAEALEKAGMKDPHSFDMLQKVIDSVIEAMERDKLLVIDRTDNTVELTELGKERLYPRIKFANPHELAAMDLVMEGENLVNCHLCGKLAGKNDVEGSLKILEVNAVCCFDCVQATVQQAIDMKSKAVH